MGSCRFSNKVGTVPGLPFVSGPQFPPPAGKLTGDGLVGLLVANDTKVSRNTLVQLFFLSSSGLIGSS